MNDKEISTTLRRSYKDGVHYNVRFFGHSISATVTDRASAVRSWLFFLRHDYGNLFRGVDLIVGLGVQWRPTFVRGDPSPPPATIQLCVGHRCLIFQILRASSIPAGLVRFLEDERFTYVGRGNATDRRRLREYYGLEVAKGRELRRMAKLGWNASMEVMAEKILGYAGVKKPRMISTSEWDSPELTAEQVQFACVDAYLALQIGLACSTGRRSSPAASTRTLSDGPL